MMQFNQNDFMLEKYIEYKKSEDARKAKSRIRFERDLFCALAVISVAVIAIMISCFKIENYLEEIMYALLEIAYGS